MRNLYNDLYQDDPIFIAKKHLPTKHSKKLKNFHKKYQDVFAWEQSDMIGIPLEIIKDINQISVYLRVLFNQICHIVTNMSLNK